MKLHAINEFSVLMTAPSNCDQYIHQDIRLCHVIASHHVDNILLTVTSSFNMALLLMIIYNVNF